MTSSSSSSLRSPLPPLLRVVGLVLAFGAAVVSAHEHHGDTVWVEGNNFTNEEPYDQVIFWHIGLQIVSWGVLFPIGMVLGINRSRFHVPWQVVATVLSLAGNYLGHHHGGRSFHSTAHGHFASYLKWYLIAQTILGIFLKTHTLEGTKLRKTAVVAHGVVGKSFPVVGWAQMIFGGIAALGFCFGEHVGQCAAHFIMGSAFIAYAMILLLMMRVGAGWLLRRQISQEMLDSSVIMVWGIVNTFTEHRGNYWSHKDMQHVSLGVLWWAGGALGIALSRKGKRSVVPAVIIIMTGYAMSAHAQSLEFSTSVHKLFGFSLEAAGVARIIEICFVLKDAPTPAVTADSGPSAFQHLTPFLLVLSGMTFLSATEEQVGWIGSGVGMDAVTYANILFSTSFVIYLMGVALLELYERTRRDSSSSGSSGGEEEDLERGRSRTWHGLPVPMFARSFFPGQGRMLGHSTITTTTTIARGGSPAREQYESVPLTASSSTTHSSSMAEEHDDVRGHHDERMNRSVFDLGDESPNDDDDGTDQFWEEKEIAGSRSGRLRAA